MEVLAQANGWIRSIGILEIIVGILTFFTHPLGIIVGTLEFISGVLLVGASRALEENSERLLGENLRNYFYIKGVLAILAIIVFFSIGL